MIRVKETAAAADHEPIVGPAGAERFPLTRCLEQDLDLFAAFEISFRLLPLGQAAGGGSA